MNEYTYKAKKLEDGEWTKGSLFAGLNTFVIMQGINFNVFDEHEMKVTGSKVDKDTICRYAGESLWEHDIIVHNDSITDEVGVGVIKYANGALYVEWKSDNYKANRTDLGYWMERRNDITCIGNEIDSPELLNEVEKCLREKE